MAGCDEDGVGPSRSELYITIDGTRMKVGKAIHTKGTIVAKKGELEKIFQWTELDEWYGQREITWTQEKHKNVKTPHYKYPGPIAEPFFR